MKIKGLILLSLSVLLVLISCTNRKNEQVDIFSDGKTDYQIVYADGAPEEAVALAKELAALSGANPQVVTDSAAKKPHEILIGDTNRAETAAFLQTRIDNVTLSAFHFIIGEQDGKLVILADTEVGYIYALDYIKETYMSDRKLSITAGTCDVQQVLWDDYYNSDLYYDRLAAESDEDRYGFIRDQLNSEANRYEDNKGNPIMTEEEAIAGFEKLIANFETAYFGEYKSSLFTDADIYDAPTVYPGESHPRIYFTENSIDTVRKNLSAPENATIYKRYELLANSSCDGVFEHFEGTSGYAFKEDIIRIIEAKAFAYAMTGKEIYGYEAIYAIKNAMISIDLPKDALDASRVYSNLLYTVACVYDWCYDLLTELDKTQIIAGAVNLVGARLEVCFYNNVRVPSAQGAAYGHGAEYQLLSGYLSFAIACYGDASEIYEFVGGRVLNDYADMQNFLFASGSHWEGSNYGPFRTGATLLANILINKMTDGAETPIDAKETVTTMTYYYRPDGEILRIGDVNEVNGRGYSFDYDAACYFFASNLYKDSYLKSFAYKFSSGFTSFYTGSGGVTNVQFLAINDPTVDYVYAGTAPLTRTTTYPHTNLFARTSLTDKNGYMVYMTMPETFVYSHSHADCGSFQIYYKGILASASGAYDSWGGTHHMGYYMQTVSANSVLIYNPNLVGTGSAYRPNLIYTGGQSVHGNDRIPNTLSELLSMDKRVFQCVPLGAANVEENGEYLYSYIGGDMTNAYDAVTASEVTRYMFSVATGNAECPYVFMTFDRITSLSKDYKKTALIHTQTEPTLTEDGKFAIVTNGDGKMVVQSVGFDTDFELVGGEGKEYMANGQNIPTKKPNDYGFAEYGWGRIEISPEVAAETNHMLSVMYVTDATNNSTPIAATEILSENLAGAEIFGKTVLFSKNEKLLTETSSFTINTAGECFIAGVSSGTWTVTNGSETLTVEVKDGTNLLTFTAEAGTYTISK